MKNKNQNQNEIKTVFYQGVMLIGETQLKNGKYRMSNPLMIRQLPRTEENEQQIHLSPFGMGFFENPLFLPQTVIIGKTTAYGIEQYLNATAEIRKITSKPKKTAEDVVDNFIDNVKKNIIEDDSVEISHTEIIETSTDISSTEHTYLDENHNGDTVEESNEERES